MTTEIKRAFNGSDDYLHETSSTLHSIFTEDIAVFTTFDTTLNAAFSTSWLANITSAGTVVRDSQIKDIQAQKTLIVVERMQLCRLKFDEIKYFSKRAFPTNKAIQAEFGIDTYEDARKSQSKMILFLDEVHKAAEKYQTELEAAGMTAAKIAEIDTLRIQLLDANTSQERYIKGRPVLTQERIITLNNCYADTIRVIEAAQIVYANDYARKNQFVYNPNSGGGTDPDPTPTDDTIIAGIVRAMGTNAPIAGANITLNTTEGAFVAISSPTGSFSITLPETFVLEETANIMVMKDGYLPYVQIVTIIPNTSIVFDFLLDPA